MYYRALNLACSGGMGGTCGRKTAGHKYPLKARKLRVFMHGSKEPEKYRL